MKVYEIAVEEYLSEDENASHIVMKMDDRQTPPTYLELTLPSDDIKEWPLSPPQMWIPRVRENDSHTGKINDIVNILYGENSGRDIYSAVDFFMKGPGLRRIPGKDIDSESLMHILNATFLTIETILEDDNIIQIGEKDYGIGNQEKLALVRSMLEPIHTMSRYERAFIEYAKQ